MLFDNVHSSFYGLKFKYWYLPWWTFSFWYYSCAGVSNPESEEASLSCSLITKFEIVKFGAIICCMYCTVKTLILSLSIMVVFLYLCTRPSVTCFVAVCGVNRGYWNVTYKHPSHPPLPKNMMLSNCRHSCCLI